MKKMSSIAFNSKIASVNSPNTFAPLAVGGGTLMDQTKYKYQSIAPASTTTTILGMNSMNTQNDNRKKYAPRTQMAPYSVDQTQSVQRRNARERNRVKQVNNSFAKLRQHIPQPIIADLTKGGGRGPDKKISKVDTLRIAVEYIRRLHDLVEDLNSNCSGSDTASNSSYHSIGGASSTAGSPPPQMYYSAESPTYQQEQQQKLYAMKISPSESAQYSPVAGNTVAGGVSPTSSFSSNASFDSGTFEPAYHVPASSAIDGHLQLKFEPYDSFALNDDDCTPDDEEILDYISMWQEQ